MTSSTLGHLAALFTVIVWGTTFISTKILLFDFSPLEILFYRFSLGFLVLCLARPRRLKTRGWIEDKFLLAAGLCGITLYFLLENIALLYTYASNVCLILAFVPFLTALFSKFILGEDNLNKTFFTGFVCALSGILLIVYNSSAILKLNPLGDFLALLAALIWAIYSILLRKISTFKYDTILCTRNIFGYGLLLMLPAFLFLETTFDLSLLNDYANRFNLLYLGICASALCFGTWSWSVNILGPVKTSMYIYVSPIVTLITSAIILDEKITFLTILGTLLIFTGLIISGRKN
ncbi:MAG TPA: DMT family transporter [Candidatus Avacidaminococcus intestinavium]|uniref:DMT family transporter n=1 Tax=Candidatus Avacidaminococcus intestinavium TaxID=2840684 RepID=A0A9D1MPZ5_9FIRM|nr:DMT family transporter [Candidatus Avacidaminococcus intestinavium]